MSARLFEKFSPIMFLLSWSSGAIVVKLGLQDASVCSFLAMRNMGAFALFTLVCWGRFGRVGRALFAELSRPVLGRIIWSGLALQVAYQSFFFLALDAGLSPGLLAIVLGLQPMLMPVIARDALGWRGYSVLLLGFAGLVVVIWGSKDMQGLSVSGLMLAMISVLAMSYGTTLQSRSTVSPLIAAWVQSALASVVFFVVATFEGWRIEFTGDLVASLIWMTVVVSVGSTLLLLHLLSSGDAGRVGVLFYLVPVLTFGLDILIFGAETSLLGFVGCATVAVSVFLFRRLRQPTVSPSPSTPTR